MNDNRMINKDKTACEKLFYEKPALRRVELAIDETLSSGCKLEGPCTFPNPSFDGGS